MSKITMQTVLAAIRNNMSDLVGSLTPQQLLAKLASAPTEGATEAEIAAARAVLSDTGGNIIVKDEGTQITASATSLTFSGAGVTAVENGGNVTITIPGGADNGISAGANDQLIGVGDSIMAGLTSPNTVSIPMAIKAYCETLKLCTLTNDGVPGARLKTNLTSGTASGADLVARYATNVFPKRPAATGARRSILLVDIGANDFPVILENEVSTWCSVWEAYCAQARADGFLVIAFTIMRRGNAASNDNTTQNNSKRLLMNNFIRRSRNVDGYVDAAVLIDDMTDASMIIDLTHPTDLGNKSIGRVAASEIERMGMRVPELFMPSATLKPVVASASVDILERAALNCISSGTTTLKTAIPAVGTGDFTVTFWCRRDLIAAGSNVQVFSGSGFGFGVSMGSGSFGQLYALPGTGPTWSYNDMFSGVWHFCAIVRISGITTYYIDAVQNKSVADTVSYGAITKFLDSSVSAKIARPRVWSRGLSSADIKDQYDALSAYAASQDYIFALDDGYRHAGYCVDDLSISGSHFKSSDLSKVAINSPGRRGSVRLQTVGSVVVGGFLPINARVTAWAANVTASSGGNIDLSDVNGTGRFFNGVLTTGLKALPLAANPIAISSTSLYCNAAGYTMDHIVDFLLL